jgi:hypothetical protein
LHFVIRSTILMEAIGMWAVTHVVLHVSDDGCSSSFLVDPLSRISLCYFLIHFHVCTVWTGLICLNGNVIRM